jgi:uncharacterized protein YndB with AHSA1/START domain
MVDPLIIERSYNVPAGLIWKALTDPAEMKKWYFDIPGFKPVPGHEFQFVAGSDEKKYIHLCRVMEVVTGKKISYTWRYDGYEGGSEVTFEIFEEGDTSLVRITHQGLETFPQETTDFARSNFEQGWTYFLDDALKNYLLGLKAHH